MRTIAIIFFAIIFNLAHAQNNIMKQIPGKTITLDALEEMFLNINENTDWDTSDDMLWGYFFTHHEPSKLEAAKEHLISKGYNFVNLSIGDKEEPNDPDVYWLNIEKVETHSPQTLNLRNDEFYVYAHEMGIDSYDGMDVAPVGK